MASTATELINPAFLAELRRIELRSRRNVDSELMGNYRAAFRGSGLIFSDLREYLPGDDVKHIHWKVTARTGKAFVKSFDEDRQLRVVLAIDQSASTLHGAPRTKNRKAAEFAALISLLALRSQDSVGLCMFSDSVEDFLPPKQSRTQSERILLKLLSARSLKPATDIGNSLRDLRKKLPRPALVFLISDFISPPFVDELRLFALRHDVVGVMLEDALDHRVPSAGIVEFIDPESQERVLVDTGSRKVRQALAEAHEARVAKVHEIFQRVGGDFMRLDEHPLRPFADLMRRRSARFR